MKYRKIYQLRIIPLLIFSGWSSLHVYSLYVFGYTWQNALADSLISNGILAAGALVLWNSLSFYRPGKERPGLLISWCLGMAFLVGFSTIKLLGYFFKASPAVLAELLKTIPLRMGVSFLVISCTAMISVVWFDELEEQAQNARKREGEKLAREAELFRLHQQLQPHFLFNSLNSISALIVSRPLEARKMIQYLSDFLRGTLKKEQEFTKFHEELKHLNLYIEIEKLRFGSRLVTEMSCTSEISELLIPSMILQPLFENAIKFGLYGIQGRVEIRLAACMEGGLLKISIVNPYDPLTCAHEKGAGFAMQAISRRLYLLYGRTDLFFHEGINGWFTTRLSIPQVSLKPTIL